MDMARSSRPTLASQEYPSRTSCAQYEHESRLLLQEYLRELDERAATLAAPARRSQLRQ